MPVITKIAPEGGLIGQAESPRERDRLAERPQSAEKGQVRDEFRCRAGSEGANVDGCAERRQQWHGAPGYRGWATNEDREPSRLSPGEAADNGCIEQSGPGRQDRGETGHGGWPKPWTSRSRSAMRARRRRCRRRLR